MLRWLLLSLSRSFSFLAHLRWTCLRSASARSSFSIRHASQSKLSLQTVQARTSCSTAHKALSNSQCSMLSQKLRLKAFLRVCVLFVACLFKAELDLAVRLDEPRQFLLSIDQRSSQMKRAILRFAAQIPAIQLRLSECMLLSDSEHAVSQLLLMLIFPADCVLDAQTAANTISISGIRTSEPLRMLISFDVLTQDVAVEVGNMTSYLGTSDHAVADSFDPGIRHHGRSRRETLRTGGASFATGSASSGQCPRFLPR